MAWPPSKLEKNAPKKSGMENYSNDPFPTLEGAAQTSTLDYVKCNKRILTGLGRNDFSFLPNLTLRGAHFTTNVTSIPMTINKHPPKVAQTYKKPLL